MKTEIKVRWTVYKEVDESGRVCYWAKSDDLYGFIAEELTLEELPLRVRNAVAYYAKHGILLRDAGEDMGKNIGLLYDLIVEFDDQTSITRSRIQKGMA